MIISASRRTDIPTYYSDWFFHRLKDGYFYVPNPVNKKAISRIAVNSEVVDCFVFWSKNPEPMIHKLPLLKKYPYYFQFTLNPYGPDIEKNLPEKSKILDTFRRVSNLIGAERVIWRYDPLLLTNKYTVEKHIRDFYAMASQLQKYTTKCVISFLDVYRKNKSVIKRNQIQPPNPEEIEKIAFSFSATAKEFGLQLETCAEKFDLRKYGIGHASCIDPSLLVKIIGHKLTAKKDKNQRPECGCMESIDIGTYNTCPSGCLYCYANFSENSTTKNCAQHNKESFLLFGQMGHDYKITERKISSFKQIQETFFD